MKIVFTRHALRRMKLYSIPEQVVRTIVENMFPVSVGKHTVVSEVMISGYPLKIVFSVE